MPLAITLGHAEKTPGDAGATLTHLAIKISGWSASVSEAAVAVASQC